MVAEKLSSNSGKLSHTNNLTEKTRLVKHRPLLAVPETCETCREPSRKEKWNEMFATQWHDRRRKGANGIDTYPRLLTFGCCCAPRSCLSCFFNFKFVCVVRHQSAQFYHRSWMTLFTALRSRFSQCLTQNRGFHIFLQIIFFLFALYRPIFFEFLMHCLLVVFVRAPLPRAPVCACLSGHKHCWVVIYGPENFKLTEKPCREVAIEKQWKTPFFVLAAAGSFPPRLCLPVPFVFNYHSSFYADFLLAANRFKTRKELLQL